MTKKIFTIVFVIVFSNVFSQKTYNEIIYYKALKKFDDTSNKAPMQMKGLEYRLITTSDESYFKFDKKLSVDNDYVNKRFIGHGGGKGVYYKNLTTKTKLHQTEESDELFIIKSNIDEYKWKLTKESKYIGKYKCYKATAVHKEYSIENRYTETTITVWYTLDIPLPFGPAGYDGLPGLVLEVRRSSFYFIASKVSLNKTGLDDKIKKPKKGKVVSLGEYNKILYKKLEAVHGKDFYNKYKKKRKKNN